MSQTPPPAPPPPPSPAPATPPAPRRLSLLGCAFALSFLLNLLAVFVLFLVCLGIYLRGGVDDELSPLHEKHHSGDRSAADKVAVVHVDGILLEGLLGYAHRQIDQAARDPRVKAVVLRVDSPGGSVTASEDLYRRLVELRDGNPRKKAEPKPLVASLGGIAASGGYYVAMPASTLFAERTTLTGSVGVYVSLPNVKELGDRYGVTFETIKAGRIKDSGSPFKKMTDEERQVWQDLVNDSYSHFLAVVEKGRPALAGGKLLERFRVEPLRPDPRARAAAKPYTRYRADGGVFTAPKAKELKLIDSLGTLDDAVQSAAEAAGLGENYHAVEYQRPLSLAGLLLGTRAPPARPGGNLLDAGSLREALTPRVWYLAPGYESAGALAGVCATERREGSP